MIRGRELRRIERRCRDAADRLELPSPFDVQALCTAVGRSRGRPIHLLPVPLASTGLGGLLLGTASMDVICYERDTSPHHQEHIICHELGHLLFDHGHAEPADPLTALFPDLSPGLISTMLTRQHAARDDRQETEAELFAFALLDRARNATGPADTGGDDWAGRLRRALEF